MLCQIIKKDILNKSCELRTIKEQFLFHSEIKNDVKIKHNTQPPDNDVTLKPRAERKSETQYSGTFQCRNEIS